jgi:hypothetical protein
MGKLLLLVALGLAPTPSPGARPQGAAPPARACDEMRARVYDAFRGVSNTPERMRRNYEAAREFSRVCGDSGDEVTRHIVKWVEKYEAAVRAFEAGRDGGALGFAAGASLAKGLTEAQ